MPEVQLINNKVSSVLCVDALKDNEDVDLYPAYFYKKMFVFKQTFETEEDELETSNR